MTSLKCLIRQALTRADLYKGKAETARIEGDTTGAARFGDLRREQLQIAADLEAQVEETDEGSSCN